MLDDPQELAQRVEVGRRLFAGACTFVRGCVRLDDLPVPDRAEVAFVGRSNVGKSSLVNGLTGRRALAKVSNTPGRTQQLNYFDLGGLMYLVDLPGYGFAKAPKSAVETWTRLMKSFLRGRVPLRRVYLLIDSRHGIKPVDQDMLGMLTAAGVSSLLVLTKADKIKAEAATAVLDATQRGIKRYAAVHPEPLLTSSETGVGIELLRADVARFLD